MWKKQTHDDVPKLPDQCETRRRGKPWDVPMMIVGLFALGSIMRLLDDHTVDDANVTTAKAQIRNFQTLIVAYKMKLDAVPSNLNDLVWNPLGVNFMNARSVPKDPWGNDYVYALRGERAYLILSYGADGAPGGKNYDADITSDDLARN